MPPQPLTKAVGEKDPSALRLGLFDQPWFSVFWGKERLVGYAVPFCDAVLCW